MMIYQIMLDITACGKFKYDEIIREHKLCDLIQGANKFNAETHGWIYKPLLSGGFGYDNLAMSIGNALMNCSDKPYIDELSNLIHEGWIQNYVYWRDNSPFVNSIFYKKPYLPLGDETRNKNAVTPFELLDEDEKEKVRVIARYLLTTVFKLT